MWVFTKWVSLFPSPYSLLFIKTVITELNQKISCIGDVVVSGKEKSNEKNAKKTEEVHSLPTMKGTSAATAEGKRLKKTHKRSAPYPMYESDWKTESEDGDSSPNYKPKQKKQVRRCKFYWLQYSLKMCLLFWVDYQTHLLQVRQGKARGAAYCVWFVKECG